MTFNFKKLIWVFLFVLIISFTSCIHTDIQIRTESHYIPNSKLSRTVEFIETRKEFGLNETERYVKIPPEDSSVKKKFLLPEKDVKIFHEDSEKGSLHVIFKNEFPDFNKYSGDVRRFVLFNNKPEILHENSIKITKKRTFFKIKIKYEEKFPSEIIMDQKIQVFKQVYSKWQQAIKSSIKENILKEDWDSDFEKKLNEFFGKYENKYIKTLRLMYKIISLPDSQEIEENNNELEELFAELDQMPTELSFLLSDHLTPENEINYSSENSIADLYEIFNSQIKKVDLKEKLKIINEKVEELFVKERIEDDLPKDILGVYRNIDDLVEYNFISTFKFNGKLIATNGKLISDGKIKIIEWHYKPSDFFLNDFTMRTEFEVWNYGQIFSLIIVFFIVIVLFIQKKRMKKAAK
ncbi:MAG: hypothetical protein PHV06_10200 [bacterium]|nr:hypothetical protein [bacterium]